MSLPPPRGGAPSMGGPSSSSSSSVHSSAGPVSRLQTPGFAGYNLAWSPFYPDRMAVAGSANYGLVGNGRLHIVGVNQTPGSGPLPQMQVQKTFDTQDGLYDVAWSELHENQLVTASGDGSIKLWDTTLMDHPIRNWHEHGRETFSVDWNNLKKELFVSGSWDASAKIWHPQQPRSLSTITAHTACVYSAMWSPHSPDLLSTACGDGHLRLFDLRSNTNNTTSPIMTIPIGGEVLTCDWNKYKELTIATGSTDKNIKLWDLRNPSNPQLQSIITGHNYAIRRIQFSPHSPNELASASYDMSVRIWNTDHPALSLASSLAPQGKPSPAKKIHDAHTEFVVGLGWSLYNPGLVATTAWDMSVHLWAA
ncbi:unnamed protein product [Sympodiomycopsis kandeliae]